ncbi:MAG: permease-like cell division protein FtsX [Bacteroidales bacterium]|nr:permease-like cell division protein FtsX [Bacteroidales bacterium]MBQ6822306.1 permease-like cell division protein FtsX [Bacteroidales bacterium]MBR0083762.1 permease-like cell division protein FtsX [Bacteroidales bacterium]MBR0292309.1 permease-like cell division protein FtsX [Bacteroidales bacterium]
MAKEENKIIRRRLRNAYASSIISISLVLLLIGIAALLIVNARSVSDYFKENMQLSVILKPDVSDEDALSYQKSVETLPFIKGTRLVTREEGAAELAGMLGDDFLSVFETSPVPVSLEITLQADYVAPDSVAFVRRTLSASDKVEEVEYQQSLVETLNANLAKISLVLGVFILLMLFISFVLINNTVRLGVFSRRFTVHTMQLVGATRRFIRKPFMNGALLQGLVSSVLALVALAGVLALLRRSFPQMFAVIELRSLLIVAGTVIVCGVAICLLSTYLVVNKLVSLDKDRLYY